MIKEWMVAVWYSFLLYVHICSVILSIGPYFVLFPLLTKMRSTSFDMLPVYIEPFRFTVRLTKHAGHILVTTGVLLTWLSAWTWHTPWILSTVVIMVGSLYFIARAFSPLLRKLQVPHDDRSMLIAKLKRALIYYVIITMAMMWLMVSKPTLWG
jgi:hypothetical protein